MRLPPSGPSQSMPRRLTLLAVPLLLLLSGCGASSYGWGWHILSPADPRGWKNIRFLLDGYWATLSLSLTSIAISIVAGALLALLALARNRALRTVNRVYVELFRAIPLRVDGASNGP